MGFIKSHEQSRALRRAVEPRGWGHFLLANAKVHA